ncbi:MAG: chemotaxis protein CheW [Kofleriaceae bacterium]
MSDTLDFQEFVGAFVAEADELVAASNAALELIETGNAEGSPRPRAVRDLFRALHTIKGLAAMIGVEPIVEIAHVLETLVRGADRAGANLQPAAVTSCVRGVDAIAERVRAVAEGRTPARAPADLIESIEDAEPEAIPVRTTISPEWEAKLSPGERAQLSQAFEAGTPVSTVSFVPSDALAASGITIGQVRQQLSAVGDILKIVPRTAAGEGGAGIVFEILIASSAGADVLARAGSTTLDRVHGVSGTAAPPAPAAEPVLAPEALREVFAALEEVPEAPTSSIGRAMIRVEVARLDALQEQLSLLIISRFRLQRELVALAERGVDVRALREIVELQGRQLRGLRRAILQARLVRATEVLEPLSLLVRSLARSSRKDVRIEIHAGTAELDKSVADRLLPALVHIIRNAVDHAIEPADERGRQDKPPIGWIRVSCREIAGNQIELVISDDGRGIDREAVARKAKRAIESDVDLLDVLTQPGFSTRDAATRTSGRGLGMDIVRRVIAGDLGGELSMTTSRGVGTVFTMRIPVTIAVLDVFSFECSDQSFVVPVSSIEEIFELELADLVVPPTTTTATFTLIERRGRAIPVVSLGRILAIGDGMTARKALLIRRQGEEIAFTVDRMVGRQEVVIRPIDDPLVRIPGITGATDLGDGRPTLVLDLGELSMVAKERRV